LTQEKRLLASFIADFKKGKKAGDPLEYARTCSKLVKLYGSPEIVSKKLGVGKETIRILSKIPELHPHIQNLISQRRIPLTVAFDLIPLDCNKQVEAANAIVGLPFKDARKVIRRISANPRIRAATARAKVLDELERKEANIAIIALPKEMYQLLSNKSKDVPRLIRKLVDEWLVKGSPLDRCYHAEKANLVSVTIKFPRRTFSLLRRRTRKPANLVEGIVMAWLKQESKI